MTSISPLAEAPPDLDALRGRTVGWLERRRAADGVGFGLCAGAHVPVELNASTGGMELWIMHGLELSTSERQAWIAYLQSFQNPATGLVIDPSWIGRQEAEDPEQIEVGDSFFTMTAAAALEALGAGFRHPVAFLVDLDPEALVHGVNLDRAAHHRLAIGDIGWLIRINRHLGIAGAEDQWHALNTMLGPHQDAATGLWPAGGVEPPLTPSINRTFHVLRASWNLSNTPVARAEQIIDSCLVAARDEAFYGWARGYACNDLDIAHVAYSAAQWTDHRRDELGAWARRFLGHVMAVEKPEGGFSFYHERAMDSHGNLAMSPGRAEADTWGTLMYLGAVRMLVALGWPGLDVPWTFSHVHAVPKGAAP